MKYFAISVFLFSLFLWGCHSLENGPELDLTTVQDSTNIAYTITGLDGPEAVRYDPDQEVYFISNFNGGGNDQDSTGFITKADAQGNITELKFMTGTEEAPLHAPRGMFIVDETLWVADVLGVHGFDKNTGLQTDFIDFTEFEIGFLNDVAADQNGVLYITDTGTSKVYKVDDDEVSVFLEDLPHAPNGITLNPNSGDFLLAPWNGDQTFYEFNSSGELTEFATLEGGFFDGIEFIGTNLFSASQADSSIRIYRPMKEKILIKTTGRPADIGINTHKNHVAVPYIALDKVEIWDISNHQLIDNNLAPVPDNEFERLVKLSEYDIDYSEIHGKLDDLTKLAAYVTGTPISLVNLLEANTQCTISNNGFNIKNMPRNETACQYAILDDDSFEVEDMSEDERFNDKNYVQTIRIFTITMECH